MTEKTDQPTGQVLTDADGIVTVGTIQEKQSTRRDPIARGKLKEIQSEKARKDEATRIEELETRRGLK